MITLLPSWYPVLCIGNFNVWRMYISIKKTTYMFISCVVNLTMAKGLTFSSFAFCFSIATYTASSDFYAIVNECSDPFLEVVYTTFVTEQSSLFLVPVMAEALTPWLFDCLLHPHWLLLVSIHSLLLESVKSAFCKNNIIGLEEIITVSCFKVPVYTN